MLKRETVNTIIQALVAFGTIAVSIVAIWEEPIRAKFVGPELKLSLRSTLPGFVSLENHHKAMFYHIDVKNNRLSVAAKKVKIVISQYEKKRPDGSFVPEPLIARPQLTWTPMRYHEQFPTIARSDTCDLGFLEEGSDAFILSLYNPIPDFLSWIKAGEGMRVYLIASADNFESRNPSIFEVNWNGKWSADKDELHRNLTVKEVKPESR